MRRKLPVQPGPGEGPAPLGGARRDAEKLRCLLITQSDEEPKFDQFGGPSILKRQLGHGLIDSQQGFVIDFGGDIDFIQIDARGAGPALESVLAARRQRNERGSSNQSAPSRRAEARLHGPKQSAAAWTARTRQPFWPPPVS